MQKLKRPSTLHDVLQGQECRKVPGDEQWFRRSQGQQPGTPQPMSTLGAASRGRGETQEPSRRGRSCLSGAAQPVGPAGPVLPGPGSLNSLVRIKQINENNLASKSCVWGEEGNTSRWDGAHSLPCPLLI